MNNYIPLSVPNLKGKELEYITHAIETEWVSTGGSYIRDFERNIAEYLQVDHAVACQSGTAGLHLALQLAGVGCGDEVIVPTLTFIAAVNPVRYVGAEPVFMDCDHTLNLDLEKLEQFLASECDRTEAGLLNKSTGKLIKAVVVVHVFGNMLNMEKLMSIVDGYPIRVIEDATEALGTYCTSGRYKGRFAGTIGDFGVYSFNGNKIITTGGGGMLVAKDQAMIEKAKYLSTQSKDDELYYIHHEVGYNYRMTNLQAALGVAQLEQLEHFIEVKTRNYQLYAEGIAEIEGLSLMPFNPQTRPNYWLYSLVIDQEKYPWGRDELLQKLHALQIQTRPIWGLIHTQRPYRHNQTYRIEQAGYFLNRILNIPCSTNLKPEELERVVAALQNNIR